MDAYELMVNVFTAKYLLDCLDRYGEEACREAAREAGYPMYKYRMLVIYWRSLRGGG